MSMALPLQSMPRLRALSLAASALLAACGGGNSGTDAPAAGTPSTTPSPPPPPPPPPPPASTSTRDAFRLADQASFGATETLTAQIQSSGPGPVAGRADALDELALHARQQRRGAQEHQQHRVLRPGANASATAGATGTRPSRWSGTSTATRPSKPDQLRQRVAFALQQIVVVNNLEVERHLRLSQLLQHAARQRLRQLPPGAEEGGAVAGDGRLPEQRQQRQGRAERELRARAAAAVRDRHLRAERRRQPEGWQLCAPPTTTRRCALTPMR